VAQPFGRLAILAAIIAGVGCNHTPTAPGSDGSTPIGSTVYTTPPIRGLVRETNGGPIAGVSVRLFALSGSGQTDWVVSNQAGIFTLPPSTQLCESARVFGLDLSNVQYFFLPPTRIFCAPVSDSAELALELKGQRVITAVSFTPVGITLSNDDLGWLSDETGYSCGPCRIVRLGALPRGPVAVWVEWSGPAPIRVWVEGDRGYGDIVRLGEFIRPPEDTTMKVTMPTEWLEYNPYLKIGLPSGDRFPAESPQVTVRIEVRS
jgi:hypothetical protein